LIDFEFEIELKYHILHSKLVEFNCTFVCHKF